MSARLCLDMLFGPFAKSLRAARLVHKRDHRSQYDKENQNADVPTVAKLGDHSVLKNVVEKTSETGCRANRVKGAADGDSDEKRRINFLCNQCQRDRYNRGHKR